LDASFAVAHDAARSRIRGRSLSVRFAHLFYLGRCYTYAMEDNSLDKPDALSTEIEEARKLTLYAYSMWVKGDYKPKDESREDLVNLEVNFRIADSALEYNKHGKLSQFRQECLVALGM
jgi:hypothetical protein